MSAGFPPVAELLPHRGRAVLIDEVLEDSKDSTLVAAHITRAHPFFVAGLGVPAWVGIELMAQAIAAHAGLDGRRAQQPPRAGMLLGTRRYQTETAYFREGARLEILAQREFGDSGGLAACACRIACDGQTLTRATLIIVEIGPEQIQ
ncbi:MAG: 3-hydroxylacyl-ACP dehydratase [Gammaproteobacteria bacterium]